MVRRYGDPVEVQRAREGGHDGAGAPGTFLWRGRLYVVRTVLGHWQERRAWWTSSAARALHGESVAEEAGGASALTTEREVWRVEASRGQAYGTGVFDLCLDPDPADDPAGASVGGPPNELVAERAGVGSPGSLGAPVTRRPAGAWRLLRVAD